MKRFTLFILLSLLVSLPLAAKVTSVTTSVSPASFAGACPKLFEFSAVIAVDAPGVVTFKWIRSDGALAPEQKIEFKQAGKQVVKTTWTLGDATKLPAYDGWEAVQILTPNALVSNRAAFGLKCAQAKVAGPIIGIQQPRPQLPAGTRPLPQCIDPAAVDIRFEIVRRDTQFRGRVRITGVVRNIGNAAFTSNPGTQQASAQLYEVPAGATSGGTLRAHTNFNALAVGGTVTVSYERDWNSSSPAEGEFAPSYKLMIVYDPDIRLDGNPNNDDCNMSNNTRQRSGTEINAMLH